MKKLLLLSLFTIYFCLFIGYSQNIVPNGDFEFYTSCPNAPAQINRAYPWYDPNNATSDSSNSCAPDSSNISVPCIFGCFCFQNAHSGNGYCGLFAYGNNYREYIQVKLSDSLKHNTCYSVTFYINLINHTLYASNNIGAYFSNLAIFCPNPTAYNLTAQILLTGNPIISDTVNWTKINGVYNAIGGEQYLTIGNLARDSNTFHQIIDTIQNVDNRAYYFVDDVSLYEIKTSEIAGRDTTICHGDSVQLGIANYEGVTYSWQPAAGLSNTTIGNPYAKPLTTSTYFLTQTTPCAVTIDTVVVTLGNCYIGGG